MKKVILILAVLMAALPAAAQQVAKQGTFKEPEPEARGGLGLAYLMPKGTLKESHDSGVGVWLMFAYPASGSLEYSGGVAWNKYKFSAEIGETDFLQGDFTVWEFTAGLRFRAKVVYLGVEAGYYTVFKEFSLVPNAGIRWRNYDLSYRYKMGEDTEVHSIRAGVFF